MLRMTGGRGEIFLSGVIYCSHTSYWLLGCCPYVDSSVPVCSATIYAAYQSGQFLVFDSVRRHQYGSAFVLNQEDYEFRRFGLAGVSSDDVNIRGTFIEGLTGCQSHLNLSFE